MLQHHQQQAGGLRHLRRDCMDIAKMLSLGVVSEEQMQSLLKSTMTLLATSLNERDSRAVKRLYDVILSAAKLDQAERHKMLDKEVADKHEIDHQGAIVQVYLPHNNRTLISDGQLNPQW